MVGLEASTCLVIESGFCCSIFLPLRRCFAAFPFLIAPMVDSLVVGFESGWPVLVMRRVGNLATNVNGAGWLKDDAYFEGHKEEAFLRRPHGALSFSIAVEISRGGALGVAARARSGVAGSRRAGYMMDFRAWAAARNSFSCLARASGPAESRVPFREVSTASGDWRASGEFCAAARALRSAAGPEDW
jgi:hypothetical protein